MHTKAEIIKIADSLLREKGYNAFSFSDISRQLNIKNASIHYYFPAKADLGVAIVDEHQASLDSLIKMNAHKGPLKKLNSFLSIYTEAKSENKICLVGSLATDLYTIEPQIQIKLKKFADDILKWVTVILEEGRDKQVFFLDINARMKALMIMTNMLAAVQLTRLTGRHDFQQIKQTIINDLIKNK